MAQRGDYAAGYRALRRILALGEARGYEPDTSQARFLFAAVELAGSSRSRTASDAAQRAREGLIAGGDLANAGYTYYSTVHVPAGLRAVAGRASSPRCEAGLAFVRRTGNEQTGQWLDSYRWLAGVLRGESSAAAARRSPSTGTPTTRWRCSTRTSPARIAAAIFGDPAGLARHTAAAMPLLPAAAGSYPTAVARLLRGLALAGQARAADGDERGGLLAELDEVTRLAGRPRRGRAGQLPAPAAAARGRAGLGGRRLPRRRARLRRRAARGRRAAAALASGADRRTRGPLLPRPRPRARRLRPARPGPPGVPRLGRDREGRPARLGLPDPAAATRRDRPAATSPPTVHRRATVTTGTIDLLGILSASQALSSETSIERLHARVVEVLGAMTGATGVHLLLWSDERQDWLLPAPGAAAPSRSAAPATNTRCRCRCCATSSGPANRWSSADATRDDRFARDPYFADARPAARCWPCPSSAAARCGRCCCWRTGSSAARSPPNGSTRSSSSPASSPSPSTTPSCTPSFAASPTSRPRCGGWRRWSPRAPPRRGVRRRGREVGEVLGVDATHLGRYDADGTVVSVAQWGGYASVPLGSALPARRRQRVRPGAPHRAPGTHGRLRRASPAPSRPRCGRSASAPPSARRSPSRAGPGV